MASVGWLIAAGVSSLLRSPAREKLAAALSIVISDTGEVVFLLSPAYPGCGGEVRAGAGLL